MSFKDSLGNRFAGVGRFCTGVASDGDKVRFSTPWDVVPSVLIFPSNLQTSAVGYSNVNIYQMVSASEISTAGFTVNCRSILKAGSGGQVIVNKQFADWNGTDDGGWKEYSYTFPVTSNANSMTFAVSVSGWGHVMEYRDPHYYQYGQCNVDVKWVVDGVAVQDWTNVIYHAQSATVTKNIEKTIPVTGKKNVVFYVKFYGGKTGDGSGDLSYPPCSGTAYVNYYKSDVTTDTVITRGKAGFIAVDPNTVPYRIE
ncbi:hypothetical protein CJ260_00930 [Megasphaera sp. ASD88]|uniref:hypothetical protein n=1 Tax=Megasphaera sp. ASD88 TaxID=2027407 RepID=UPI000BAB6B9D|nr:hypothetical protein [Megasphaera sp. ASD88]PAV40032.1 hypothetical protein CJ260_00930 [Megasphaera sp. ASD88]